MTFNNPQMEVDHRSSALIREFLSLFEELLTAEADSLSHLSEKSYVESFAVGFRNRSYEARHLARYVRTLRDGGNVLELLDRQMRTDLLTIRRGKPLADNPLVAAKLDMEFRSNGS